MNPPSATTRDSLFSLCDQLAPRGPLGGRRLSWSQATHASLVLRAQEWTGWGRPRQRPAPAWNLSLLPTQTCFGLRGSHPTWPAGLFCPQA